MSDEPVIHLRASGVSLVLDHSGTGAPVVLHWGADLGDPPTGILASGVPVTPHSALDRSRPPGLLPEYAHGYAGRPGLTVSRTGGTSWSSRLETVSAVADGADTVVVAADEALGLTLRTELHLEPGGLLRMRHTVTNTGPDELEVRELLTALPVPAVATELLDLSGRWCRERSPQRRPLHQGAVVRESRRGRTGHDASLLMVAGTEGFGFGHGELWSVHVAWS
ncbi:MAG: alpha-galactosidase, partial [Actinomycetota bacterium]|nr:alpha-galactosidase [Actinomycetota bacterium]